MTQLFKCLQNEIKAEQNYAIFVVCLKALALQVHLAGLSTKAISANLCVLEDVR